MKKSKWNYLFTMLVLFVPISIATYLDKEWNIIGIFLVASILVLVFSNIEDFELFKVSKEGVELKRIIDKAQITIDEASKITINMLKLNLNQTIKMGYKSGVEAIKDMNLYYTIYKDLKGVDGEVDELFIKAEKHALHVTSWNLLNILTIILSFEYNLSKFSEEGIKSAEKLKKILNPKDSSIQFLEFYHEFYHDIDTLSYVLEEMLQIFQPGVKYLVAEYDQTSEVYLFLSELKNEVKKYKQVIPTLTTNKK